MRAEASAPLRTLSSSAICDGRPAIITTGNIIDNNEHFPVAWQYDTGWFYLNMGWGGADDGWYSEETSFFASMHL